MGKITILIGGLVMLFAHTIINSSTEGFGGTFTLQSVTGFFLYYVKTGISNGPGTEDTETFESSWIEENGFYEGLFGNPFYGITILAIIVIAIVLAFTQDESRLSGILLILAAAQLLIFRYVELDDQDLSFYKDTDLFTYIEIPLGFIAGLIAGLMNLKSS